MDEIYAGMGRRVYELRVIQELTREELAERSGVSTKFIYEIENERRGFSVKVLCKLSDALGVECEYILFGRKRGDYDRAIMETLRLFNPKQLKSIHYILIYLYKII